MTVTSLVAAFRISQSSEIAFVSTTAGGIGHIFIANTYRIKTEINFQQFYQSEQLETTFAEISQKNNLIII